MTLQRVLLRIAAPTVAITLLIAGLPAVTVRAAEDSNIPGIPLPGSVVTGVLGGPVYDHVYSIDVNPASIILLSLTGDPGTDFDLYLFDNTATSVYGSAGQVALSTGPTATESISYSTIGGGKFYIDLNGATDVEGKFRLVVAIESDTTPPHAELRFDNGAPATQDSTVRVGLIGTDDLSGVGEMQLSTDGDRFGPFVAYAPTFLWQFAGGDGQKQLWARVRDRAGNMSSVATATITVDNVAPTIVARNPEPGGTATGLQPTISVQFSEAIDPKAWLAQGMVVQHLDGGTVAGTYSWDAKTRTGSFVPSAPLVAGEPVACTVGSIADLAGNQLASIGTWQITPLRTHRITVASSPKVVVTGGAVTISGTVDGPVFGPMTLDRNLGAGWTTIAKLQPSAAGQFSTSVVLTRNTQFRVQSGASQVEAVSTSPSLRVLARRAVALVGIEPGTVSRGSAGSTIRLTARLTPTTPTTTVSLKVTRYDSGRRAWVPAGTLTSTSSGGYAVFAWRPTVRGSYRVQLTTPSTAQYANGLSAAYQWTIA